MTGFRWFALAVVFFVALRTRADMTSITVAASVHAFDAKTVTLQVNKKRVVVPRELVLKADLHTGEAVMVTFNGANISYLFKTSSVDLSVKSIVEPSPSQIIDPTAHSSIRKPASEKHAP